MPSTQVVVPYVKGPIKATAGAVLRTYARFSARRAGAAVMYHGIRGESLPTGEELVPQVGARAFARQVHHLARHYRVVTASGLQPAVAGSRRGDRPPLSITFDDDNSCYVPLVLPVLQHEDARATFFLNGASLSGSHWFRWELLQAAWDQGMMDGLYDRLPPEVGAAVHAAPQRRLVALSTALTALPRDVRAEAYGVIEAAVAGLDLPPRMTVDHVRTLVDSGHEIGFHTREHHHLTELGDPELDAAFVDGRSELEDIAGAPITTLSYPFGDWNQRVARAAARAGFEAVFRTQSVPVRADSPGPSLGRVPVPSDELASLSFRVARVLTARANGRRDPLHPAGQALHDRRRAGSISSS